MAEDNNTGDIRLQANDGGILTIDRQVASRSVLLKNLLHDLPEEASSQIIPIPNVSYRRCPYVPLLHKTTMLMLYKG